MWLWAFLLAIALQLAFEFLGEFIWNTKAMRFVEQKTGNQSYSLLRVLCGFVFAGRLIAAGYG